VGFAHQKKCQIIEEPGKGIPIFSRWLRINGKPILCCEESRALLREIIAGVYSPDWGATPLQIPTDIGGE